ncbi:MAG: TonB-dependent receptor [Acidobacteria bacterium]|nr:TonB-dependent receptor [Acidobacteriota bacterium]
MSIQFRLTTVAVMLAAASLGAQDVTGSISGQVKDRKGAAIPNATIRLTGSNMLGERVVRCGPDGRFRIPLLNSGRYNMVVTAEGFLPSKAETTLSAGQALFQDLTLRPMAEVEKAQGATVEVVAVAAMADKNETQTMTAFSQEKIVQITGTNPYGIAQLSPGVVGGVQNLSIRGGGQQQANYMVNGMASRDNATAQGRLGDYTLDDLIESTAVIQSPLNAKYGNSSSGIVTLVTSRGSNEFSGVIRAKINKNSWISSYVPFSLRQAPASGTPLTAALPSLGTDDLQRTYEITIKGPIIKDTLTFAYGARLAPEAPAQAQTQQLTSIQRGYVPFGGTSYRANTFQEGQTQYASSKSAFNQYILFWQLNTNHSFEYNYTQVDSQTADLQFNYVSPDVEVKGIQKTFRQFYNIGYRGILGANHTAEVRYGKNRSDIQFPSGPGMPLTLYSGPQTATNLTQLNQTYLTGGATSDNKPEGRATESLLAVVTGVYDWHGSHTVDFGFERQNPIWDTVSRGNSYPMQVRVPGQISPTEAANAGMFIVFNRTATAADLGGTGNITSLIPRMDIYEGQEKVIVKNPNDSFFINDLWAINNKWSVMAGLRYDRMRIQDAEGTKMDAKTWSPRFEVKLDLFGDQSRIFNLSYGQFRGNMAARTWRNFVVTRKVQQAVKLWNVGSKTPYLVTYADITNPANYAYVSFNNSSAFTLDQSFKPEVNHEWTLGLRRNLPAGGFWRGTLVLRTYKDLPYAPADATAPISVANIMDPSQTALNYRRTLMNDPEGEKVYRSFEFEFQVPLGSRWTAIGNYTWGRTVGNNLFADSASSDSAINVSTAGEFRRTYRALGYTDNQFNPYGVLPNSIEHQAKLALLYNLTKGRWTSSIGLQALYNSGARESLINNFVDSRLGAAMIPGLGTNSDIPATIGLYWNGRGRYTNEDTYSINLQYNVSVKLKGRLELFSEIRVTNFLNHQYQDGIRGRAGYQFNNGTNYIVYALQSADANAFYNGYRVNGANANIYGTDTAPGGRRNMATVDVGVRF